ncbi:MAG: L-histidine N(alpha)-methyltransferase, partial [Nitrosopumilus sp.]|nr:L-histidine N(alpha)-methyltransferase [Nitrosopumilus sp.]
HITNEDFLLIGFDLIKDDSIIELAYNDKEEVTSKFNLNILNRINKELGGNFILENFSHKAIYNKNKDRIEMHIVSKKRQQVFISGLNKNIDFEENETIHTENSYKYNNNEIKKLVNRAGFTIEKEFYDTNNWYDLVLLEPN